MRVIAKCQSNGGECLDIKAKYGAMVADTQLITCTQDDIPYLEPFFSDRFVLGVGAAVAG